MQIPAFYQHTQVNKQNKPYINTKSDDNLIKSNKTISSVIHGRSSISFGWCTPHQGERREVSQEFIEQVKRNIEINRNKARLELLELRNEAAREVAAFMLNFSNRMLNGAEYPVEEFFMTEAEFQAQKEIKNKTIGRGTDYHNDGYLKDRKIIQESMRESIVLNDSILALISVNNLKKFKPKNETLDNDQLEMQYKGIIKSTKEVFALSTEQALENGKKFYSEEDKDDIATLVKIIRATKGADFGDDFDKLLKKVVNSQKNMETNKIKLELAYKREITPGIVLSEEKKNKLIEMQKTETGKKLEVIKFMLKYNCEVNFSNDELPAEQIHTRQHLLEHSHNHTQAAAYGQNIANNQVLVTPHVHAKDEHIKVK